MRIIFFSLILVFLSSCDPVKRHARLVEKFPYVHQDSVNVKNDTNMISIPSIRVSEKVPISDLNTPFTKVKDRLTIDIQKINDTLYLDAQCKDTVVNNITRTITRTIHSPVPKFREKINWWKMLFFSFVILGFFVFLKRS